MQRVVSNSGVLLGGSSSNTASWTVAATTGGASATVTASETGNYADVVLGEHREQLPSGQFSWFVFHHGKRIGHDQGDFGS